MATFYNQATLIFGGTSTNSNITEGQILSGASIEKTALNSDYVKGDTIAYLISLSNTNGTAQNNITLTDNLGTFIPDGMTTAVTPLNYVENSLLYYVNGVLTESPTVTVAQSGITISNISLPENSNGILIYETRVNEYADLASGSSITNTVTLAATAFAEASESSETVPVRNYTSLTIAKAIYPETVSENGEITYTFIIQNTGNTAAVATDNVIITDTFLPILSSLTVTLNGEELALGTGYEYNAATGEFRTTEGAIAVPAATFVRDATSGAVSTTPGVAVLKISGTV